MADLVDVLERARDMISQPNAWEQGYEARDVNDVPVPFWAGAAVKWCAFGAFCRAAVDLQGIYPDDAYLKRIDLERLAGFPVTRFNDAPGRTVEEVIAMYDTAIQRAKDERAALSLEHVRLEQERALEAVA